MANENFCIYKTATGDIVGIGKCSNIENVGYNDDESLYVGVVDFLTQKMNPETGEPYDKADFNFLHGSLDIAVEQVLTISNVPAGTRAGLRIRPRTPVDDGVIEFASDTPGTEIMYFEHDDYKPTQLQITVTA